MERSRTGRKRTILSETAQVNFKSLPLGAPSFVRHQAIIVNMPIVKIVTTAQV